MDGRKVETFDGCDIICPHCAERMGDCWEWVRDEPTENVCDYCHKSMTVWAVHDVTYYASAVLTPPAPTLLSVKGSS